jgi:hypothetical protein
MQQLLGLKKSVSTRILYLIVNEGLLVIAGKYQKLIISLRTAQAKEYSLDKEQTSYDDLLDGLRLSLKGYDIN